MVKFYKGAAFMNKVWIDFETFSKVDIKKRGGYVYTTDPSTKVLMLGYAINNEPAQLWLPGDEDPQGLLELIKDPKTKIYAHNAKFDYRIWNNYTPWPEIKETQLIDTMALWHID